MCQVCRNASLSWATVGLLLGVCGTPKNAYFPQGGASATWRIFLSIGGSDGHLICERSEGTIETSDPVSGLTLSEGKVLDTLREEFPGGARATEWQRATKKRGVSRSTHYRAVGKLGSSGLSRTPLVSCVDGTYFASETPTPYNDDEIGKSRIDTPNAQKSHLVSNGSHETGETCGNGQVSPVSPPLRGRP